jgi:hypothetical protein
MKKYIAHATGSLERPMSDAELEAKFRGLAAARFTPHAIDGLIRQCRSLSQLRDAGALARATVAAATPAAAH